MKEFFFMDLSGQGKEVQCGYHGALNPHLEGRVIREEEDHLVMGISIWQKDIAAHDYDSDRHSLDIWYKQPQQEFINGIPVFRAGAIYFTELPAGKDIEQMNVYDLGQEEDRMPRGSQRVGVNKEG